MKLEHIRQVAVIGVGFMGSQITQLLAQEGTYTVTVYDINEEILARGIQSIKDNLQRHLVDKGYMAQSEMENVLRRIKTTSDLPAAVKDAELVFESVFEDMDVKKNVFKQIDKNVSDESIMITSTSQLNVTEIANATKGKERVIGMHFFHPVSKAKLIEVVPGSFTSGETIELVRALAGKFGKETVLCKDFSFGFLANRAYTAMILECVQMVWERVAPPQDIDNALKSSYELPIGPLELADLMSIWSFLAVSERDKIREMGPEKGTLHPLIRMMVRADYKGGKGGKGIYDFYNEVLNR